MTAPEYRTQIKRWFVEIGVCDGGGIGHWVETEESVEVAGEIEANALRDSWLASGKLQRMNWGELRPKNPYGLFRIRQVWEDVPTFLPETQDDPRLTSVLVKGRPMPDVCAYLVIQKPDGTEARYSEVVTGFVQNDGEELVLAIVRAAVEACGTGTAIYYRPEVVE